MLTSRGATAIVTVLAVAFSPSSLLAQDGFDDIRPNRSASSSADLPAPLPAPALAPSLPAPLPAPSLGSTPVAAPVTAPVPTVTHTSTTDDGFDDELPSAATAPTQPTPRTEVAPREVEARSAAPEPRVTTAASAQEAEPSEASAEDEREARRLRAGMRRANSFYGAVGGIHAIDAGSGPVGTFRLSLMTDFMFLENFIERGDYAKRFDGALALSWTPHRMIEVFASYQSSASWNTLGTPELLQSLGDVQLGMKVFHAVRPWFVVGGDVSLRFANPVGNVGVAARGTSFGLRGNLSFDLRELASRSIPFVVRFNAQYWFDNTKNLVSDVENARYDGLASPLPRNLESRHLITETERFALGINRTDFVNLRLGFEAPIEVSERFQIDPLLEWSWAIPVNRTGFVCPYISGDNDGCLDRSGAKAFPMSLTVGARFHPVVRGLSITAAADVGLTGARSFAREVAPTMPYAVILGASYAYDPGFRASRAPAVERIVEREPEYPIRGHVRGTIVESGTTTVVEGAVVRFPGRSVNAILSDEAGAFRSYSFEPGEVALAIEHPEYESGSCSAIIPSELPAPETASADAAAAPAAPRTPEEAEVEVTVACELVAKPRVGAVTIRVVGESGAIGAPVSIALSGPESRTVTTDASGSIRVDQLPPGQYTARVEQSGFFVREQPIEIAPRGDGNAEISLVARPARSSVRLRGNRIQISRQVNFLTDSADIAPVSEALLFELLDLFQTHPELTLVEVEGHTDDRGGSDRNLDLSQRRAESVRTWLVGHGVDASRLVARGYGQSRPLVPNITPGNRARNRRVAFTVKSSTDD